MDDPPRSVVPFEVELGDNLPERIVVVDGGVTLTYPVPEETRERLRGRSLRLLVVAVD